MVNRPRVNVPDRVRAAIAADLRLARDLRLKAEQSFKIRIHLATEQGLTTQQIADELGCSQTVVSNWRIQGEQLLKERQARP